MAVTGAECPFSWTEQKEGCWPFQSMVWKPASCRGTACKLFQDGDCVFNRLYQALPALLGRRDQEAGGF